MTPEEYAKQKLAYINARYGTNHGDDYLAVLVQECQRENEFMEATAMNKATIPDSGTRTEFPSGAVRDRQTGKGRCDLLPLDVVYDLTGWEEMLNIEIFKQCGEIQHLHCAFENFSKHSHKDYGGGDKNRSDLLLSVAHRFEDGAIKYEANNWRKGIPCRCYIDSAVRHYLKWRRGDTDENHADAFAWNILCCIWTAQNMPELNEYAKGVQK